MREISPEVISESVKKMCMEANYRLTDDVKNCLSHALKEEVSPVGKDILNKLILNEKIADEKNVPICQDTGMAVFFVEIGREVFVSGCGIEEAINKGVREGYTEGKLRMSVVKDPLIRENTKDNTPAVIHYKIVQGDKIKINFAPKGFGSENMSKLKMLKPADGRKGVLDFIVETVKEAGPNACPPVVVGVGVGGTMEKACLMAKEALFRDLNESSDKEHLKEMEKEALTRINELGIGPQGLGGKMTALKVNINSYPTHIAGLPVAVNINCHVARHRTSII